MSLLDEAEVEQEVGGLEPYVGFEAGGAAQGCGRVPGVVPSGSITQGWFFSERRTADAPRASGVPAGSGGARWRSSASRSSCSSSAGRGLGWVREGPDLVSVPVGVGSLAQAVVTHYRSRDRRRTPALLSVEPEAAACVLASLVRGEVVSVTTGETVMAGLNCGTPSSLAWPSLYGGLDAAVAVPDSAGARAAALAGLHTALTGPDAHERRTALGLDASSVVVLLSTEGTSANPHHTAE